MGRNVRRKVRNGLGNPPGGLHRVVIPGNLYFG